MYEEYSFTRPTGKMGRAFDRGVTCRNNLESTEPGAIHDDNCREAAYYHDPYGEDAPRRSRAFCRGFAYKQSLFSNQFESEEDYD